MLIHILNYRITNISLCLILLLGSVECYAKSTNQSQVNINADEVIVDQNKHISNFSGNVILWLDDIMLKTTDLIAKSNKEINKHKINHILIDKPVSITQQDKSYIIKADSASWQLDSRKLILEDNVKIKFEDNVVKCDKLVYLVP